MNTTQIGRLGERLAAKYLKQNGYKILEANKRQSHNEIDLIATDSQYIVFVEVKARSTDTSLNLPYGSPASAVTKAKQARTLQAAMAYLASHPSQKQPRMDVIEVYLDKATHRPLKINHIENAYAKR